MEEIERLAAQDIPFLQLKCEELHDLVVRIVSRDHKLNRDFDTMALSFVGKQLEHMESVLTLVRTRSYRDSALIVRSMIEGYAQLAYAATDPDRLGSMWVAFAVVTSWRKMNRLLAQGFKIEPERQQNLNRLLKQSGVQFFTNKATRCLGKNQALPKDPYWLNWANLKYTEMIRIAGETAIADLVYGPLSEWHHWSPEGFVTALKVRGDVTAFSESAPSDGAQALANAFQWLFKLAQIVNAQFDLGAEVNLAEIRENYLSNRPSTKSKTQ